MEKAIPRSWGSKQEVEVNFGLAAHWREGWVELSDVFPLLPVGQQEAPSSLIGSPHPSDPVVLLLAFHTDDPDTFSSTWVFLCQWSNIAEAKKKPKTTLSTLKCGRVFCEESRKKHHRRPWRCNQGPGTSGDAVLCVASRGQSRWDSALEMEETHLAGEWTDLLSDRKWPRMFRGSHLNDQHTHGDGSQQVLVVV